MKLTLLSCLCVFTLTTHAQKLFHDPPPAEGSHMPVLSGSIVSVNVFGMPFNDFSAYYEISKEEKRRYGLSLGYVIAFDWWSGSSWFSYDHDRFACGAYSGPELRLYYETLEKKPLKNKTTFYGPELLFKYLSYKNVTFKDLIKDNEPDPVWYTRNENALVLGAEFLLGNEYYEDNFVYQYFFGFGGRYKIRNIETTHHTANEDPVFADAWRPLGKIFRTEWWPTLNFGFKVGFWTSMHKNQNP